MANALGNIRVIDFGLVLAGPTPGQIMADMGAEVIKVESQKRIDKSRLGPPIQEDKPNIEQNLAFHASNRGKFSITVDATHPKGSNLLKQLVKISDVVVDNFAPGVMERFGLDYPNLIQVKPDIIMLSISGAGHYGPLKDIRCYAPTIMSLSGLDALIGYVGERPLGLKVFYGDIQAALHGLFAVLACLNYRSKTGRGQHIDLSMWESACTSMGEAVMDFVMNKRVLGTQGNRDPTMVPHNFYRCKGEDQWVSIAVKTEEEWESLCRAIGYPIEDERFADAFKRMNNLEPLDQSITAWTANYTPYEVMDILQKVGVAAVPLMGAREHIHDPHFEQRHTYAHVDHPVTGSDLIYNQVFKMSATPGRVHRRAPLLGEHNNYVFGELLHLSSKEIAALVEGRVIYCG